MLLFQIKSVNSYGQNIETLMTESNGISWPKALAIYDKRLYYLDPRHEKLERIDLSEFSEVDKILDNEPDLKSFIVFKNRKSKSSISVI